jgi:peptidyl-prolyl cis-trans isomerase C
MTLRPHKHFSTLATLIAQRLWALAQRWLREPLVHFLVASALIFAVYQAVSPPSGGPIQADRIVLTKDDLRQLAVVWLAQGRAIPTGEEMNTLVEQRVREEILSREAAALGLEKNDEIIKRRLAQKMDFLAGDLAALQDPGEDELRTWFAANADQFAVPPRVSFRHLYFSLDRGPGAQKAAATSLVKISGLPSAEAVAAAAADRFMFRDYYGDRTPEQVAKEFGPDFATALFELRPGVWQGPIRSGYGWHLVLVDAIEAGRVPAFEEIQTDVKSAWLDQKQRNIKEEAFGAMRARYTVIVPPIEAADLAELRLSPDAISALGIVPR